MWLFYPVAKAMTESTKIGEFLKWQKNTSYFIRNLFIGNLVQGSPKIEKVLELQTLHSVNKKLPSLPFLGF